jgi:hypothetical protein
MEDKYITEFELPMRNLTRYTKEIKNNWDRLTPEQKSMIMGSFESKETFANEMVSGGEMSSGEMSSGEMSSGEMSVGGIKNYLDTHPGSSGELMDLIMDKQNDSVAKKEILKWNLNHYETFNLNWKTGLIIAILLLILIGLIVSKSVSIKTT